MNHPQWLMDVVSMAPHALPALGIFGALAGLGLSAIMNASTPSPKYRADFAGTDPKTGKPTGGLLDKAAYDPSRMRTQAGQALGGASYTNSAMGTSNQALGMLGARAAGKVPSIAAQAGAVQQNMLSHRLASAAASTPGGYNPAARQAAIYAQGNLGAQMAGRIATAQSRERLAAENNYATAAQRQLMGLGQIEASRRGLSTQLEGMGNAQMQQKNADLLKKYGIEIGAQSGQANSKRAANASIMNNEQNSAMQAVTGATKGVGGGKMASGLGL